MVKQVLTAAGIVIVLWMAFPGMRAQAKQPDLCESDADRYCSNVEPGGGRIWQCLKKSEAKLSPACLRFIEKQKVQVEMRKDVQKACKSERKKHCRYVPWDDGRMKKCLMFHQDEMSDKCRAALE